MGQALTHGSFAGEQTLEPAARRRPADSREIARLGGLGLEVDDADGLLRGAGLVLGERIDRAGGGDYGGDGADGGGELLVQWR